MTRARSFDYIVVGAGSAGCVLANRLSADPGRTVLLIEAGGKDRNPLFRLPMLMGRLFHSGIYNWRYHTEPVPTLDGRSLYWPRGKVLGGSSTINGMVYTLAVHGIAGLRIADASVMPIIISGNTNAPTIMIGEKAAAFSLAPAEAQASADVFLMIPPPPRSTRFVPARRTAG